jgi:hypothetical protein
MFELRAQDRKVILDWWFGDFQLFETFCEVTGVLTGKRAGGLHVFSGTRSSGEVKSNTSVFIFSQ